MARYPAAIWKPLDRKYLSGLTMAVYNRVNLHVAVSEADSLHGYFSATGRPSSHFYVRRDGTVEQYVDTDLRAEADLDGNDATISVETQGGVTDANGEPWTPQQIEALAAIFAWAHATHGIPMHLASDSVARSETSRGLSWHRLGIDPWRAPNGMRYSTARGKVCPGDAKIAQIPAILARAAGLAGATPVSRPTPTPPAPAPTPAASKPALSTLEYAMHTLDLTNAHKAPVRDIHVDNLQGLLLAAGYGPDGLVDPRTGRPDGIAGAKTRAAVGDWQVKRNVGDGKGRADFIVGAGTWRTLIEY